MQLVAGVDAVWYDANLLHYLQGACAPYFAQHAKASASDALLATALHTTHPSADYKVQASGSPPTGAVE